MKFITFFPMRVVLILITVGLIVSCTCAPLTTQAAQDKIENESIALITRYEVNETYHQKFITALCDYVNGALRNEQNIIAEAFSDQENPSVLWVIERWTNKGELNKSHNHLLFKTIESLSQKALKQPVRTILIRDLEPISKEEWRKEAARGDSPIIIMLFVDSKTGTEEDFKSVYHIAMPQFRSEPGVINYQLSQLEEDKTQFVTYEKFRSEGAFQYHLNFPPIKPVLDYLNTNIKKQPFQIGLHRLVPLTAMK